MAYKAIISEVGKTKNDLTIKVVFSDEEGEFTKEYQFLCATDSKNLFDDAVKSELKRLNDLTAEYIKMKERVNEEIKLTASVVVKKDKDSKS